MIYIYCEAASNGAKAMVESLQEIGQQAQRLRSTKLNKIVKLKSGRRRLVPLGTRIFRPQDLVVFWGAPPSGGVQGSPRMLNNVAPLSKRSELSVLAAQKVSVPEFSTTAKSSPEWLGRRSNHIGGLDFLKPPVSPDFWVKKLDITHEWRLHCFKQGEEVLVMRRARKIPRVPNPHPWVRSYDAGWKLSYSNEPLPRGLRDLARKALLALNLDFGAVDAGLLKDGSLLVLEVNRRPGLDEEGETRLRYAEQIVRRLQ